MIYLILYPSSPSTIITEIHRSTSGCFSERRGLDYEIIHEIYENDGASAYFESKLEAALEARLQTIVIEPSRLGDETARWIAVGNGLHKTAVLSAVGCLAAGAAVPDRAYVALPLGLVSAVCAGVYAASWQFDPCCRYQVESDPAHLQRLPLHSLTSSSPVVLVRRDDCRRRALHNVLASLAAAYCVWRIYTGYVK